VAGFEEHLVKPVDLRVLDATFRAGSSARPETDSDLRT
jgi:hypothetical protein